MTACQKLLLKATRGGVCPTGSWGEKSWQFGPILKTSQRYQGNKHQRHVDHVFMGSQFSVRSTLTSVHRTFSLTATSIKFKDTGETGGQRDVTAFRSKTEDTVCVTRARRQRDAAWSKCFKTNTSPCRRAPQRQQDDQHRLITGGSSAGDQLVIRL